MRYIIYVYIALTLLALCISCKGRGGTQGSSDALSDSITVEDYCMSFGFLDQHDIEYEPLIARGDTLPTPSETDYLLTTNEQKAWLGGILRHKHNISDSTPVFLVAIKPINDSIVLCQYRHNYKTNEDVYIATYNTSGYLVDAIFAGNCWNQSGFIKNLSDSTKLRYNDRTSIGFLGDNEFTLSRTHKEIEHNVISNQDITTFVKIISLNYIVERDGKLNVALPEAQVYEEGEFRNWSGPGAKKEWDLIDDIMILSNYPYADEKVLGLWNDLGNKVDGALAESFEYRFFEYVFVPRPEKVLRWLYDNRDSKSQNLMMLLEFEYTNSPQSREFIDAVIARLDNADMRAYFKEMLYAYEKGAEYD